jgi:DNA-binding HxlR family transcriptional regulator
LQVTIETLERQGRCALTYDATVADSPLAAALERVGDRWSLLVVESLLRGPRRWSDLAEDLPGIAPNILSDRLGRLKREALVTSAPYSRRPVRLRYELTAAGKELAGALRLLADWGAGRTEGAEPIRHRSCGTPVEARWYCPTCDRTVAEGEAEDLRFV